MKALFCFFFVLFGFLPTCGQTVVDLHTGKVRSKTTTDYANESTAIRYRAAKDSVAYQQLVVRALNALHTDSLSAAEGYLLEAVDLRPKAAGNAELHYLLGQIALATERYGIAVERFARSLHLHPSHARARYEKATAEILIGNHAAAIENCTVLLTSSQTDFTAEQLYLLRGTAALRARLYQQATDDFEQVLTLNPASAAALIALASTEHAAGRSSQALNRLNLFLQQHPQSADALSARASIEIDTQQLEAAIYDLTKAIEIEPYNPAHYAARAAAYRAMHNEVAAKKDMEKVRSLPPSSSPLSH